MDTIKQFKSMQKEGWAKFAALDAMTTTSAAQLVKFAQVRSKNRVLDVACGSGVVAVTAARLGANVTGLDLTPKLLEHARENSSTAGVHVLWNEGDVESLPFSNAEFDVVLSQFGHMFAPRPEKAIHEMLRVLKPGGTIAFSTWPPDLFMGQMFALVEEYRPTHPSAGSWLWGDQNVVRERLGNGVTDIVFENATILCSALSVNHFRLTFEQRIGPIIDLVKEFSEKSPEQLRQFRHEFDELVASNYQENIVGLTYIMTRATKI